ncbi:MAG: mechanosensitive ion channel [Bacteroidaceae bacterium]|nr:mechanosensitive ion channel [Bacteroidaceae bacterium]
MENWRSVVLQWLHIDVANFTWIEQLVSAAILLLIIAVVDRLSKLILNRIIRRIVRLSKATWDDVLLDKKVLDNMMSILPALLLVVLLPFAFVGSDTLYSLTQRLCWIYLVATVLRFSLTFISAFAHILEESESFKNKPVRGFSQMLQVLLCALAFIIIISIIVNKSPVYLLTGLGASAAVLMLVFQDLVMGLVAGIQLSVNKMMQVGDWVVVKDKGIDGSVVEITLTTVKVMNWDYTISTIPPQELVNGSFTNWQNVFKMGGRRIARVVNLDVNSVHFMTPAQIERWRDNSLLKEYIANTEQRIAEAREENDDFTAQSLRITNLTLFRLYVQNYIKSLPHCHKDFVSMVRLMEPTPQGLPMQIYFFSNDTAWVRYEGIQSSVFEYIFAIAPEFGIKMFQLPTGHDMQALR